MNINCHISRSDTMSVVDCSLTPLKENEILHKFRKIIENMTTESLSDERLLRTLRAKNFDLRKAEKSIRNNLNGRRAYRADTLTETFKKSESLEMCEFASFIGFDKDESPILYVYMGNGDFDGFVRSNNIITICLYSVYNIERLLELQRENDKKIGRTRENNFTAIFDFENFSLHQILQRHIIETGFDMLRMYQENFPGVLNHLIVVNAPIYFSAFYNIFKPILKMEIIDKLVVCSKENTPHELLKVIDADVLPAFLGGNRVDENGDVRCSSFIKFGCKVPEYMYGKNKKWLQISDPGVSEITVPARRIHDILIEVKEVESRIDFEFWSDNPIGLSIWYRKSDNACKAIMDNISYNRYRYPYEELISPYSKIQSHLVPINNTIWGFRTGTYILRFDNTFSWVSSKYVVYKFQVTPPSSTTKLDNLNNNY